MSRGIYIMADDCVIEQAIALLNSIRAHDKTVPVVMIPYGRNYQKILAALENHGVMLFEDLGIVESMQKKTEAIFGKKFFPRVNQFRKQACWFGPFDEFLYLDTDIVVFEKIIENLRHLSGYDFVCCDYQFKNGIRHLFTQKAIDAGAITAEGLRRAFNAGFWGSKKGMISEQALYESFRECASHPEYFDFSSGVSDMPVFNYLVIKNIGKTFNITQGPVRAAGEWAGCGHFLREERRLFDPNTRSYLKYLHWAGIKIAPGCPYYDIWEYYRRGAGGLDGGHSA
jgi:hypothetical protein